MKTHRLKLGPNYRPQGQTDYEYLHSTACGYVRDKVTLDNKEVDCKLCLREMKKVLDENTSI